MWISAARSLWAALACAAALGTASAQSTGGEVPPVPDAGEPAWLSDVITRPHANIATDASPPQITVMPLDAIAMDAVGLLPASITGLPRDLWGASTSQDLARLIRAQPIAGLPAIQSFTQMLALAELDPPRDAPPDGEELLLARLDMLLARGALDPAQALMERAGPEDPAIFRRWFDVTLLTDRPDRACATMNANPSVAPTFPARIFCLARGGDWSSAALLLGTGVAVGEISEEDADLIARFLDPELFEDQPRLPPDPNLTPLEFQMRAAVAERPYAASLPLAFVHADLSVLAGWRAQLDAAERLTRSGAIAPQQWFAIYTAQAPSASGAVWDRVAAVQAFDAALLVGDAEQVATHLPPAWQAMEEAGLAVAFANIYAERLIRQPLTGEAGLLARRVGLLSPLYEEVALGAVPQSPAEAFAFAIARGLPPSAQGADLFDLAIATAFRRDPPEHRYRPYLQSDRLGEALLRATLVLSQRTPDANDLSDVLLLFRQVGLEDLARRTALQLYLLQE